MRLSVHPDALAELSEAVGYYNSQRLGLGLAFFEECDSAVQRICAAPDRYRLVQGTRRLLLRRFQHSIIYRLKGETVHVVAFPHHSRRPDYWRVRLTD